MCVLGWISRAHARDGNEIQTPWHCWLPAKRCDAWLLNSSKSKTHLKFMKLGMLSWSDMNMPWWKFCPIWGRFGYKLLTNQSFSKQAWWFQIEHPYAKWEQDLCISWTQTIFLDDRCEPLTNNLVQFASVILGMLPFVKQERLAFVYLVTLPFVNLVTLRFIKICSYKSLALSIFCN